ncbi:MAG: tRNA (guanosine(37)-N1)-methyltransferase TrmD [Alphaproteobacteria bacterium]|nr:tRNA (guanosine(37)-N1)-methyltransferase TrmD [Alphaproteobacteria bacterium]MCL2758577.1 tRNA (guanosine(37)-N1)-methyltransferase TrmD [Alphaproteobacteria bacterium]
MHFNIITLFPEMFPGTLGGGVVGRALDSGVWSFDVINPRDFATDNYASVDDAGFGGGAGMVMRADILGDAIESVKCKVQSANEKPGPIIYFSPRGKVWNQKMAREFANNRTLHFTNCTLICGRYEGIDQRVIDEYGIMEISIGDYILSGGEIAAQVFIDSIVRLVDNVVHSPESTANESFEIGGLEWPLYTRPSAWRGRNVPEVLLSGHHGNIERWRKEQSDEITKERRPDLLK